MHDGIVQEPQGRTWFGRIKFFSLVSGSLGHDYHESGG